jgi:hypothetical protein
MNKSGKMKQKTSRAVYYHLLDTCPTWGRTQYEYYLLVIPDVTDHVYGRTNRTSNLFVTIKILQLPSITSLPEFPQVHRYTYNSQAKKPHIGRPWLYPRRIRVLKECPSMYGNP